jgi:hypothetical protein
MVIVEATWKSEHFVTRMCPLYGASMPKGGEENQYEQDRTNLHMFTSRVCGRIPAGDVTAFHLGDDIDVVGQIYVQCGDVLSDSRWI